MEENIKDQNRRLHMQSEKDETVTGTIPLPMQGKDMDIIMKNLESGVEELFTSERYQDYLRTMSRFHNYSFNNTLLIAMQRPDATLVTGYKNWQSMGRQVKKGEKGITIIAPVPIKRKREKEIFDENARPVLGADGKPLTEEVEVMLPYFKAITVFDINQTTGDSIQTLSPEKLTAAVEDYDLFLNAIQTISPVPMRFDEISGEANGYYHNLDKEIVIQAGMSESQTLKTAIHETAHAMLHDKEIMESQGVEKDRHTKEVEAESVAFCVCSAFALDTSEYSFPYIAGWSSGRDMMELKASMDIIRKTAGEMIDELYAKIEHSLEEKRDVLENNSQITFYAAECSEFPVLGEIHQDLSLSAALEAYEKIPAERMNGLKSVGFNLKEGSDYDGMMDLMVAGQSQREILATIPYYRDNKLVQAALDQVDKYIAKESCITAGVEKSNEEEKNTGIKRTKSQKRREDMSL